MEILYVLIPLGLVLVAFGLWAFFWATGDGQFDDLDSPGWSVLDDDAPPGARPVGRYAPEGPRHRRQRPGMMGPQAGSISLAAALVAGLAASGHCIGMCGGIAGALAMRSSQGPTGTRLALALAYNLSRITSYAIAGAIAGLLGRTLLKAGGRGAAVGRVPRGGRTDHAGRGRATAVRVATARPARVRGLGTLAPDCAVGRPSGAAAEDSAGPSAWGSRGAGCLAA